MTNAQLTAGDTALNYEDHGSPAPGTEPLVLLHGFVGSTADWSGVLPELAADRRVLAYDHRGHGGSAKPGRAEAYSFDALEADLGAFLDTLGLGPVDLLGHSMGGVVAQRYALAHPDRVRSLVLMDTAPEPSGGPLSLLMRPLEMLVRRRGMGVVGTLAKLLPKPRSADAGGARGALTAEQRDRQAAAFLATDPEAFAAFARALRSYPPLTARLGGIACPTTVLVGAGDKALRRGAGQLVDGIPGARLVVVDGAKHSPQTEQPQAWLAAVRAHFERLEGPR
ncbi:alpha/beta fold hydrolase [Yinghuangia soli]|uniref:Alpha/beta hydrolase n=1 Tax=Yinghuangia soli TaxID=2908204 RepID=A0AA41Q7X9_9ACTN|nr:alpha/beta hydrolase [Yinghuangia soli]MCF2533138.1 alpha/beta hydrolase [Yinghuangia soli]